MLPVCIRRDSSMQSVGTVKSHVSRPLQETATAAAAAAPPAADLGEDLVDQAAEQDEDTPKQHDTLSLRIWNANPIPQFKLPAARAMRTWRRRRRSQAMEQSSMARKRQTGRWIQETPDTRGEAYTSSWPYACTYTFICVDAWMRDIYESMQDARTIHTHMLYTLHTLPANVRHTSQFRTMLRNDTYNVTSALYMLKCSNTRPSMRNRRHRRLRPQA